MVQRVSLRGNGEPLPLVIVRPGQVVVRQAQPAEGLWVVESGFFRLSFVDRRGRELADLAGPGDPIGEPARRPAAWTARALRPARLRPCPPELACGLLAGRAARLAALAHGLATLDVPDRIEHRLADLAERFGRPLPSGGVTIGLRLTQDDVAALAGTTRESVSRALRKLRAQGRVACDQGRYVLHVPQHEVA